MKKNVLTLALFIVSLPIITFSQNKKNITTPKQKQSTIQPKPSIATNQMENINAHTIPDNKTLLSSPKMKSNIRAFEVNGIKVIVKSAANDVVSLNLFISGGVDNYNGDKQGIENLVLQTLVDGGSKKFPKELYHDKMERMGISISASSSFDYSTLNLKTITKNWQSAWEMFHDVVTNPSWNENSFAQIKGQTITNLLQLESDPDETISELTRKGIYITHKYFKNPEGTPEVLNALTLEDAKKHYQSILKRKKLVISICGKISEQEIREKVKTLSFLEEGTKDIFQSNPPKIVMSKMSVTPREIATNYMRGVFSCPPKGTKDYLAMRLGMSMLSDRLFVEVRTKRNLSYAPGAGINSLNDPYCFITVSTTGPNTAAQVMLDELKKIKTVGFTEKELKDMKEGFLTSYYMGQETNSGQALTLGAYELTSGWEKAETLMDDIRSITVNDINEVMKKHITHIHWFYLGDDTKVDEKIFLGL